MSKSSIVAASIAALLAVVAPAAAIGKPKKPKAPRSATFRLEIKGEQLTTWKYIKEQAPPCDFPEYANGSQYIEFGTYEHGDTAKPKVKIKRAPGDTVAWEFVRDDITMTAEARLERNYDILYSQISDCPPGGGPFGGEDPPADAHGTNECRETGELDLALSTSAEEIAHPSYPTPLDDAKPPKSPLYFAGLPYWTLNASDNGLPALCGESGQDGADIGIVESQGEWAGGVITAVSSLSAKKLLGARKRKTKVEFNRSVRYPNAIQTYAGPPSTTGKTTMDATFTFTRVGG
jgi:hypothetical protein